MKQNPIKAEITTKKTSHNGSRKQLGAKTSVKQHIIKNLTL